MECNEQNGIEREREETGTRSYFRCKNCLSLIKRTRRTRHEKYDCMSRASYVKDRRIAEKEEAQKYEPRYQV